MIKSFSPVMCISMLLTSMVVGYTPPSQPTVLQDGVMQWSYDGRDWSYISPDGEAVIGRFCDSAGDVYYAGEDGKLLCEGYLGEEYFGADGRLVNPSVKGEDKFRAIVDDYEAGEEIVYGSIDEVMDFMHWYTSQWSLGGHNSHLKGTVDRETGRATFFKDEGYLYDYEAVLNEVFDRLGRLDNGLSDMEKIKEACSRLSGFTYEISMQLAPIHDVLATSSGVCWQFARLVQCLLEDVDMEVEVVQGTYRGNYHAWLRVRADGRWVYVDPTAYVCIGDGIVSEDTYLQDYRVYIQ